MQTIKMTRGIDLKESYKGIWKNKGQDVLGTDYFGYGFFYLWINNDGTGEMLERYRNEIFESDISLFSNKSGEVSFKKRYCKPRADLSRKEISYIGKINPKTGLVEGLWQHVSDSSGYTVGEFFMAETVEIGRNLGHILLEIEEGNIKRDIIALQKELPSTQVIPYFEKK